MNSELSQIDRSETPGSLGDANALRPLYFGGGSNMGEGGRFQFPVMGGLLLITLVALLLSLELGFWCVLLISELVAIYVCVEVLTLQMPVKLYEASQENCCRIDGSRSRRRSARERRALRKVRSDLWAVLLIVAFIATSELYVIDSQIMPLSLSLEVVAAMQDDTDFKTALRQRDVDGQFLRWSRSTMRSSNEEVRQRERWLWRTWPAIVGLVLGTFIAGIAVIRYAYLRVLRDFQIGVAARANEYLNLDIGRMQG